VTASSSSAGAPDQSATRPALVATVVALVAFLPSLAATYVYDDLALISNNPYAHSLTFLFRGFRTHLWDVFEYGSNGFGLKYYRPVVTASYVLNWVVSGGAPWAFHLVNVLCHAAATLLAARVATRWTGDARLGLLTALIFALHPTRTESVVWVSGRTDVFMALFILCTVELTWSAANTAGARAARRFAAAIAALALALLSKEAAAATALLVTADCLVEGSKTKAGKRFSSLAYTVAGLGAAYVVVRSIVYPVAKNRRFDFTPSYGFYTVWAYVERLVCPWPQTFFYRPAVEHAGVPFFEPLFVALGVAASIAFVVLLVVAYRRDRAACLLIASGTIFMGPLFNFTYTGIYVTSSDHFLYFPVLLWAAGLLRLFRSRMLPLLDVRAFRLAAVGVLFLFAAVDGVRVLDYRDDVAFWNHELEVNHDNPVALVEVGGIAARSGDLENAYSIVKRALEPASMRYFLLAGDRDARISTREMFAALDAALRADGDVRGLEELYEQMEALLSKKRSEAGEALGPVEVLKAAPYHAQIAAIVSDMALVATRIGRMTRARQLADALTGEAMWQASNPMNLVLAYARLGEFARARETLSILEKPPYGMAPIAGRETLVELRHRLAAAEALFERAKNEPGDQSRIDEATAYAELGAYLQALRVIRPVFDRARGLSGVGPLYVQLLISARLHDEALETATALLGPEQGRRVVQDLESQLTARVRSLKKPEEPSPWWPG
jgi:tetratricopeptide (TPR) repeat protein